MIIKIKDEYFIKAHELLSKNEIEYEASRDLYYLHLEADINAIVDSMLYEDETLDEDKLFEAAEKTLEFMYNKYDWSNYNEYINDLLMEKYNES